ncbi:MAG: substrate-binding domain-containing protein, partial [Burkholderiales bacterium]|nr:substrate-binding domain-containing protein [Anaerolineae bacterium]
MNQRDKRVTLKSRIRALWIVMIAALLVGCGGDASKNTTSPISLDPTPFGGVVRPENAIDISIIYAPESDQYMPQVIADFNSAYANGRNPLTEQPLASGERPIYVTGGPPTASKSSGDVTQGIVNAVIAPNNANVERPTMFAPSVSHWLTLANYNSGRQIFDLSEAQPTALAPVVIAIWESRLRAIQETVGYEDIGWEELLDVLHSPNGWADYGIPNGRRAVYYGHANPINSSTALSALIEEFYACARQNGFTGRRLSAQEINVPEVQQCVRDIEELVRHYARRTEDLLLYIPQGPDYLDFVAMEEVDVIDLNQGDLDYLAAGQTFQLPERLIAVYPKEGTFWHEHPIGIVNAEWVTDEQREAARVFTDYVLTPEVQTLIMSFGFRPANPDVQLGFPFVEENGVSPDGPTTVLDVPTQDALIAIQQSWTLVRKQADVLLLIDVSGSMEDENKIGIAREAAVAFLENMEPTNRVA